MLVSSERSSSDSSEYTLFQIGKIIVYLWKSIYFEKLNFYVFSCIFFSNYFQSLAIL